MDLFVFFGAVFLISVLQTAIRFLQGVGADKRSRRQAEMDNIRNRYRYYEIKLEPAAFA